MSTYQDYALRELRRKYNSCPHCGKKSASLTADLRHHRKLCKRLQRHGK